MSAPIVDLDDFDRKILGVLRKDGRITFTDLSSFDSPDVRVFASQWLNSVRWGREQN